MNNKRRKTRELNKLSAYLDNALTAREMRKLEARLAVEPALQEQLDNLRSTKLALSRLTRLKAPRNFTLTPDMVPMRKPHRQPLQGVLRLASALAAVLLVVSFGARFILNEIRQHVMLAAEAPAMEAARAPDEAPPPEPLIQWGPPGTGGEAGGMGGDSLAMEELMLEMETVPEEEAAPEIAQEEPEEAQAETEQPASKGGDLILGINPDQGGEIIDRSEPAVVQQDPVSTTGPDLLFWAQITLGVIAVGSGLALLILRHRKRT